MARWVGVGIQQPRSGVEPATSRSQVPHRTTGPPRISETPVCVGVCVCVCVCVCEKSAVKNTASYNQKQKSCNLQPFWCRGVSRGWHYDRLTGRALTGQRWRGSAVDWSIFLYSCQAMIVAVARFLLVIVWCCISNGRFFTHTGV